MRTQSVKPGHYSIDNNTWDNAAKCVSYNGPRSNRNYDTGEVDTGDRVLRVDVENQLARDYSDTKYLTGNTAPLLIPIPKVPLLLPLIYIYLKKINYLPIQ